MTNFTAPRNHFNSGEISETPTQGQLEWYETVDQLVSQMTRRELQIALRDNGFALISLNSKTVLLRDELARLTRLVQQYKLLSLCDYEISNFNEVLDRYDGNVVRTINALSTI